jgi:site-specific recombinase XerD
MDSLTRIAPELAMLCMQNAGMKARSAEFFTVRLRKQSTRRAYTRAIVAFAMWCKRLGLSDLREVQTAHIQVYLDDLVQRRSSRSINQYLY